jgi:hypothetical protein
MLRKAIKLFFFLMMKKNFYILKKIIKLKNFRNDFFIPLNLHSEQSITVRKKQSNFAVR